MTDKHDLPRARDLWVGLGLLTRLPLPVGPDWARGAKSAWCWPLVGLVTGGIGAAVIWVLVTWGLPQVLAAGVALAAMVMVTGALHEDGLADVADGFWGGFDPARRLEIMADSRIGAYGVIALVLILGLRWQAMAALPLATLALSLIAAEMAGRAAMVALMTLPPARPDGLSARTGRPPRPSLYIALALGTLALAIACGLLPILVALALMLGLSVLARTKIGGQTGDVLGATQQVVSLAALLSMI